MIWKDCRRADNIFSITLWAYVIARVFGNWPFSIEFNARNGSSRVRVTKIDFAWFLLSLCIYASFNWFAVFDQLGHHEASLVEVTVSQISQIIIILVAMLSIIMDLINRNVIWQMVLTFHAFDEEVRVF